MAAADGAGEDGVGDYPEGEVADEEEGDVDVGAEPVVEGSQDYTGQHDGRHGGALGHAEGEELVVDVGLVGEERAAVLLDAV